MAHDPALLGIFPYLDDLLAALKKAKKDGLSVALQLRSKNTVDTELTPENILNQCMWKKTTYTQVDIRSSKQVQDESALEGASTEIPF